MPSYKVTACWYETVYLEAEDENDALDKAYKAEFSGSNYVGSPDDYEVIEIDGDQKQVDDR